MTNAWNVDVARAQYAIANWGENYFDVDTAGRLTVHPRGADGPELALSEIVDTACAQGSHLPLLVRFADILTHRLGRLQAAFAQAMRELNYSGSYSAVYPVKVNQQHGVVSELARAGDGGFGLEAGSKPELMAVLAMAKPESIVICNGYKDREYLRLALIGRKLGLRVFIVIEKPSELAPALEEARALGVQPLFGVRMRLTSLGAGKWQNTGGEKSKFGLTPRQLLTLIDELKAAKGAVVNVTSIAGSRVHPFAGAAYATSKAALASLTREMAADFGPLGIRVNAIAPGEIDTAILSPGTEKIVEQIPMQRLGTPDEVAKIIYVLCTETASYVTGAEIHINGGQHV